MSLAVIEVEAEEAVATDLASADALLRAVALLPLHHPDAFDAHPLQIAHELRHGDEPEDPLRQIDPDHHRLAVHDALLLLIQGPRSRDGEGTSLGLQVMIAEGYPEIPRDLLPQKAKTS